MRGGGVEVGLKSFTLELVIYIRARGLRAERRLSAVSRNFRAFYHKLCASRSYMRNALRRRREIWRKAACKSGEYTRKKRSERGQGGLAEQRRPNPLLGNKIREYQGYILLFRASKKILFFLVEKKKSTKTRG